MEKKLKVAFLISGRSRYYIYQAHTFLHKVFRHCNADIYISFQANSKLNLNKNDVDQLVPKHLKINIDDDIDDKVYLTSLFGDKLKHFGYDNEEYINSIINSKINSIKNNNNDSVNIDYEVVKFKLDQYARVKNIAEIFESCVLTNNETYDVIVRTRLDQLFWIDDFNLNQYITDTNALYVNYRLDWDISPINNKPNWIRDFFYFGNPSLMLYLMKNFVTNMYNSNCLSQNNINYAPEVEIAKFINSDIYLNNKTKTINLPDCLCLFTSQLYINGYYLGEKKNVYKHLRIAY